MATQVERFRPGTFQLFDTKMTRLPYTFESQENATSLPAKRRIADPATLRMRQVTAGLIGPWPLRATQPAWRRAESRWEPFLPAAPAAAAGSQLVSSARSAARG
jgi:hypothetical protein